MGIINKIKNIFRNKEFQIEKTSKMLDEDIFWDMVELSIKNTKNLDSQEKFLIESLEKMTPEEIIGFRLRTDKLLYDTYNSEMWCAGYIMNGGCSDDSFEYFRNWIISRGKDVYYNAKKNPDTLVSQIKKDVDFYEFESFWYVALEAFENKTEKELYDYISDDFKIDEVNYPEIKFNWDENDQSALKKICPKLFNEIIENK